MAVLLLLLLVVLLFDELVLFNEFDGLVVLDEAFAWPLTDDSSAGELALGGDGRGGGGGAPAYRAASANIAKSKIGGTPWALRSKKRSGVSYLSYLHSFSPPAFLQRKREREEKKGGGS